MAFKSKFDALKPSVEDSENSGFPILWSDDSLPMESHPRWEPEPVTPEDFYFTERPEEARLNIFRQAGNAHRCYNLSKQ